MGRSAARDWSSTRFISMPEKKSILFAGSDEGMKEQVAEVLDGIATYSLTWVGESGDLLLKILDKDIDLAIIDENLAGMAGSKLIKIIKKSRPRIPLIIISSGNSKEELARVLEQGVFYFILKPINGQELKEAVESGLKISN
jgi:DNA-binding NtrC family response regulator